MSGGVFDDFLHFLKIKNFFCGIHQNYLVALIRVHKDTVFMSNNV